MWKLDVTQRIIDDGGRHDSRAVKASMGEMG